MMIADTDVLIDYLAGKGEADEVERMLARGALRTTVISRFELLSGAKNPKQLARLVQLLEAVPSLGLDDTAADAASEIRRSPRTSGPPHWDGRQPDRRHRDQQRGYAAHSKPASLRTGSWHKPRLNGRAGLHRSGQVRITRRSRTPPNAVRRASDWTDTDRICSHTKISAVGGTNPEHP